MRQYCQKQHAAVYNVKGHTSLRERRLQFSRFNFCQVSDSYSLLTIVKQQEIISETLSGVRVTVIDSESMILSQGGKHRFHQFCEFMGS